jgi:hypothetical protein
MIRKFNINPKEFSQLMSEEDKKDFLVMKMKEDISQSLI